MGDAGHTGNGVQSFTWGVLLELVSKSVKVTSTSTRPKRIAAQYQSAIRAYMRWFQCLQTDDCTPYLLVPAQQFAAELDEFVDLFSSQDTQYCYASRLRRAREVALQHVLPCLRS